MYVSFYGHSPANRRRLSWGAAQRGWYALKPNVCRQMRIDFTEIPSEEATEVPEKEEKTIDYPTLF